MRYINRFLFGIAMVASMAGSVASHAADDTNQASLVAQGKYIAIASDCAACHTMKSGKPFAGGLGIVSPVGTIYASNISPSTRYGIGNYTEAQFADAVRKGIRRDGANLYPAMPYTSYAVLTDQDIHALYAYFLHGVAPVDEATPATNLPFPMNIRLSMKGWNMLFLSGKTMVNDPSKSVEWNRGRYLVEGPAHCSTCHTPRGFLMQEEKNKEFSGGLVGAWYAPNITSDPISGIGSWSQTDLPNYLHSGHLRGKAQAAGSMGEAVEHSFQYLSDADLNAIAIYIKGIPAVRDSGDKASRFDQGNAGSDIANFRGMKFDDTNAGNASGAQLFQGNCASCHSPEAQGSKDGYYPSLFHNSVIGSSNPNNLIATILNGVNRTTAEGQAYMPGFGGKPDDLNSLSNEQIASLANYVLSTYGQPGTEVRPTQVEVIRQGGPTSNLVALARAGMIGGAIVLMLIIILLIRRKSRFKIF
ncbi:cytochrome c [Rhodanobacter sp. MP1X3]|uniref:cytochrome c n=1 Tax=Rhodanobacter sp. MP1X3 TaxID=2723086 RepID=UPI0018337D70|nr:cytochrome c [Rhodanobacter sp. MP1X3]MBB6243012.1 mono/diheme cytochrome c family protein [Rhodanobacter sp. MP1X3]